MDHWRSAGPAGPIDQWHSRDSMSRFLKQIKACGFDAIDTFDFRIWQILGDYGLGGDLPGLRPAARAGTDRQHLPRRRLRPADLRPAHRRDPPGDPEDFRVTMDRWSGIQLDNIIDAGDVTYDMAPVTPDKIKTTAALWNAVGEITLQGRQADLPSFFLRHPVSRGARPVLRRDGPALRQPVRRHRAALHRCRVLLHLRAASHRIPLGDTRDVSAPAAPSRPGDHGADHGQMVLRNGHRGGPRRLRGDDAGDPRQRLPGLDQRRARTRPTRQAATTPAPRSPAGTRRTVPWDLPVRERA